MKLNCKYLSLSLALSGLTDVYTCRVDSAKILQPGTNIKVGGQHQKDKTNNDVRGIEFFGATVHYIPKGLHEIFPNLTHLIIDSCGLTRICRQDLIGLENLVYLSMNWNRIEILPDDVFADMKSLKRIDCFKNEISSMSWKVLEPIKHLLEFADFRLNRSVDFVFSRIAINSIDDLMRKFDDGYQPEVKPEETSSDSHHADHNYCQPEESKSQDFSKIFHKKFERLWTTGAFSDLTVFAGGKQFKVHKTVLAVHSPVLARIYEQQSKFEEGQPDIEFSAEATEEALEHLYTGKLPSAAKAPEVLELAVKYEMQELKEVCVTIVESNIDETNALDLLELANRHGIPGIKTRAFAVVRSMFPEKRMDEAMIDNIDLLKRMVELKREYNLLCKD